MFSKKDMDGTAEVPKTEMKTEIKKEEKMPIKANIEIGGAKFNLESNTEGALMIGQLFKKYLK